jgi:transposase-like protein
MMAKPAERAEARRLRRELGMPIKRIAARLGVSLSSVSLWVRDIELDPAHRERNRRQEYARRATTWSDTNRAKRLAYQEDGRKMARRGDPLHQAGCMLYWAEGSKDRNAICFANSDQAMVRFFVRFLRTCFDISGEDLTLSLNVYTGNGLTLAAIERHWLTGLQLPESCLRAHIVNHFPTSSSGRQRNKLPYGVCSIKLFRTRIVQHIYGAIQEYAGFEEPRWLDGRPLTKKQRELRGAPSGRGGGSQPRRRRRTGRRTERPR